MPTSQIERHGLASGLLTFTDSQILRLLCDGTSERRVIDIGVWRRSWTTEDVHRVARDYLNPPAKHTGGRSHLRSARQTDPGECEQWLPPVFDGRPATYVLTPAQGPVLTALCEGLTTPQIAEQLNLAEETIKSHVKSILATFGAHDRLHLVSLVLTGHAVVHVQSRAGRRAATKAAV